MKKLPNPETIIIAVLAFLIVLLYTRHGGIGISPDSIVYLSVARNLNVHGALLDYNLQPLVDFPSFYPMFLGLMQFISRIDVLTIAPILNSLMFSILILLSAAIISRFQFKSPTYRLIVLILLAISPALLDIYAMLWSETLFMLLELSFILLLYQYFNKRSLWILLCCALLAGLASITRYAGITLIGTGLMMLLFDPNLKGWIKIKNLVLFAVLALLPLTINFIHNAVVNGELTGPRQFTTTPLMGNIAVYGQELCKWFPGLSTYVIVSTGIALLLFIGFILLFFVRAWRNAGYATAENILAAFFIVYSVFIVGMSTISHFEGMNNRLLSPLYIPLILGCSYWIPKWIAGLKDAVRTYVAVFIMIIALFVGQFEFFQLKELYRQVYIYGIPGYTEDGWKNSELSAFLRKHPTFFGSDFTVYSNAHEAVYFLSGLRADDLPHNVDKEYIHDFFGEDGQYLIWFNTIKDEELISLDRILENRKLLKRYDFKDGTIYFLLKK